LDLVLFFGHILHEQRDGSQLLFMANIRLDMVLFFCHMLCE
jgi:hypothetical protein